jgi:hypothetical protein
MKLLTEYLEHALTFKRLAAGEEDPKLKAELEGQATAYRKLATDRAVKYGLPLPCPARHERADLQPRAAEQPRAYLPSFGIIWPPRASCATASSLAVAKAASMCW